MAPDSEQLDARTTASALAAITEKIEIIAAVKPEFRSAGIITKMASNIDAISQGRFAINLVSAWWLRESEMLGVPVLPHDERYARSEEFLTVNQQSWLQNEFRFSGKCFSVNQTHLVPKPVQQPHPLIYIVGESVQGRNFGVKMADTFLISGSPLTEAKEVVMLKSVPYAKAQVGTNGGIHAGLVGTPEQIAERMRVFEAVGIETFLLQFHPVKEELERFGKEVMPLLN